MSGASPVWAHFEPARTRSTAQKPRLQLVQVVPPAELLPLLVDLHPEDFVTVLRMVDSPPEPTPQLIALLKPT